MKRYRFTLDQVLRVRRIQEEQARAAVGLARRDVDDAAARTQARLDSYRGGAGAAGAVPVGRFLADRARHELQADLVAAAQRHEDGARRALDGAVTAWSQAAQRVKGLERLEERRREEHAADARKAEELEVEDIVSARVGRVVR